MIGRASRQVIGRVLIEGTLRLETPAHFGNGDVVGVTDMPLLRDPVEGKPLLTGASLAGALRNYLCEYERGYGASAGRLADRLFGKITGRTSVQSWLIVDDALGDTPGTELRDGVAIDPKTRTAEKGKKYDIELLQAGSTFPLSFELLLTEKNQDLLEALALALHGLESGEIGLGQRKRRGFGRCRVESWRVRRYDLTTPKGLIAWLADDRSGQAPGTPAGDHGIVQLLNVNPSIRDQRRYFTMEVDCSLASSLLIRSGSGAADAPDMVHLTSKRNGEDRPILSGTSLAGAMRSRALRIANTLWPDDRDQATYLIDKMFGRRIEGRGDEPSGSRVLTRETELADTQALVQSRVRIDRFTGGSYPTALFTQQPAFGGEEAMVKLEITLRRPEDAEIGLLLLVLKDLWTGDLPLGGESSVGRGRLHGQRATLALHEHGKPANWRIEQAGDMLQFDPADSPAKLEAFVEKLQQYRMPEDERRRAA